jgi:hypothetical protein
MGNSNSRETQEIYVDHGRLEPTGKLYPNSPADYDVNYLRNCILERRISPFYEGIEDLTAVNIEEYRNKASELEKRASQTIDKGRTSSLHSLTQQIRGKRNSSLTESRISLNSNIGIEELVKDPVECPICFLVLL